MRIHYLQHEPFEDPGSILEWAVERRHSVNATMVFKGEPFPALDSFDMLVIMGGSMNVYDEEQYPWLSSEKKFIAKAIHGDKAVLGICLGAQLIANVLGARVYKNPCKEFGWFPVSLRPAGVSSSFCRGWPVSFTAFHWHSDTFDIPKGARWTAFSKACKNQAFEYGDRTIALQFHIESTEDSISRLLTNCEDDIVDDQLYIQSVEYIKDQKWYLPHLREILYRLLDTMEKNINGGCTTTD